MDGTAVVLCEGAYLTTCGKTAHGLVRHTDRYRVLAVIDSTAAGADAGEILDGRAVGIPVVSDLGGALRAAGGPVDYLVVGVATHGGVLPDSCRLTVREALATGISVDSGLHQMLSEDPEFAAAAQRSGARIRDVRRPPPRSELHPFSGEVVKVDALRLAVLGTDSGVGKRTTTLRLVQGLNASGVCAEMIGTGQTSWLQGVRYGLMLDSLINDFVSGEIEHQVCRAFREQRPDVIVVEGQGALTNPAYPGGFEIVAGARPDGIILQHAPSRLHYDGFPDYPLAGVAKEKALLELLSGRPVVAITLNHAGLSEAETRRLAAAYRADLGVPCCDPLVDGVEEVIAAIRARFPRVPR
jgi:uncharacterized NAD-dependent epimerase/dehydratase family protein